MLVALAIDAGVGWPDRLYRAIGHPVGWFGRLVSLAEAALNRSHHTPSFRRAAGAASAIALILLAALLAWLVQSLLPNGAAGVLLAGLLAWPLVAARSLHDHVERVATPLVTGDTAAARAAVAMIVGRNPEALDEAGVARAALESLAENASDGVVAPLFWGALLGLPGIAAYKAANTLDSMIGHRNERYRDFGWGAARIDDVLNLIPARLTGALIAVASRARGPAFRTMRRDAGLHRSPNAGWPEASMAGALGVRLSGPRMYDGVPSNDPWLNPVAGDPRPEDLFLGLRIFRRTVLFTAALLLLAALF
ncbi:cobalamin biosynthesis protein CobD [Silicimonas algicola]|nr:cobalamin biosynthesis protein CobD [Silicimonas algicola]